jgi:hypothetical protein
MLPRISQTHPSINDAIVANMLIGCQFGSPRPFT